MHLKHKLAAALAAAVVLAASGGLHAAPRTPAAPHRHAVPQGLLASPSTCDPFADWDDDPDGSGGSNGGDDSTTNDLTGRGPIVRGPARVAAGAAAQVIGTTPEAIHRNFTGVVTRNLANAGTASRVARLSDVELAAIARVAAQGAPTERAGLLKLLASRLDGAALVRVARAFGRAPVEAAVAAYASPGVRAAFDAGTIGLAPPPPEGGSGGSSYPRPNLNMTLEEIYLEFRTAPVGSLSPSAALAETSMYAGTWLYVAYKTGDAVGTALHQIIEAYAPGVDRTLGEIIGSMVENFWLASDAIQQGHYEAAFDDLFGFPVTRSSDPFGDWDVSTLMMDYYQTSGTCGY